MYGYNEPLRLDEIPVPDIAPDDVLVKVAATGMCRSDFSSLRASSRKAPR